VSGRASSDGTAQGAEATVIARGAELLHAQCWLWGQDLRGPHGNLLETCGLEGAVFAGARSHRRYYGAHLQGGRFVVAWGGGLLFGDAAGALFFPRLLFAPVRLDDVRSLAAVPDLNSVHAAGAPVPLGDELVDAALRWLAAYEDDVLRHAGPSWRSECARRWSEIEEGAQAVAASVGVAYDRLAPLPASGLAASWRELRDRIATQAWREVRIAADEGRRGPNRARRAPWQ